MQKPQLGRVGLSRHQAWICNPEDRVGGGGCVCVKVDVTSSITPHPQPKPQSLYVQLPTCQAWREAGDRGGRDSRPRLCFHLPSSSLLEKPGRTTHQELFQGFTNNYQQLYNSCQVPRGRQMAHTRSVPSGKFI